MGWVGWVGVAFGSSTSTALRAEYESEGEWGWRGLARVGEGWRGLARVGEWGYEGWRVGLRGVAICIRMSYMGHPDVNAGGIGV